jgi:hypothetical protein
MQEVEDGFIVWADGPFVVRGSGIARNSSGDAQLEPAAPQT